MQKKVKITLLDDNEELNERIITAIDTVIKIETCFFGRIGEQLEYLSIQMSPCEAKALKIIM